MLESHKLELVNLLNGVAVEEVSRVSGDTPERVTERFTSVMRRVAEYQFVHCIPRFDCETLAQARRSRLQVMEVLSLIERWDATDREVMLTLLKGNAVQGIDRAELEAIVNRALDALPCYLDKDQIPEFFRDRRAYLLNHRSRVIAAIERFVSLDNPLTYKRIEHVGIDPQNLQQVVASLPGV